jgi:tetrahedral aminopeptidase
MKNQDILNNLQTLTSSLAVSGYEWEQDIAQAIMNIVGKTGERVGNNLVYSLGSGTRKVMICAHMDEVGFIVTSQRKNSLKVMPIGDVGVQEVIKSRITFDVNGKRVTSNPIKSARSFSDLRVDVKESVPIGTIGTFAKSFTVRGDKIISPALDNKVGCLVLIELLQRLETASLDKQVIVCFADREELACTGVMSSIRKYDPDIFIDIDSAYALPLSLKGKKNWKIPTMGKGCAIQLMGTNFIIPSEERRFLERVAKTAGVAYQYEIPDGNSGGTNTTRVANAGYKAMQVNIPVANQHSAKSVVSISDIKGTMELVGKLIKEL